MNMYGHISYMIIHVYKYLYMIIYLYIFMKIHMHDKFFINIIDFIFEYIVLICSQIKCTK